MRQQIEWSYLSPKASTPNIWDCECNTEVRTLYCSLFFSLDAVEDSSLRDNLFTTLFTNETFYEIDLSTDQRHPCF